MLAKRTLPTTAVLALLLSTTGAAATSAQDESTTPPEPPATPEAFAAQLSGNVSFTPLDAPTDACPMGVLTATDASGPSTLGPVTVHSEHCPTFGAPSAPGGQVTVTTATGDMFSGAYFVDCAPVLPSAPAGEVLTCPGRIVVTGGTGTFEAAAGSISWTGYVWFPGSMDAPEWPWFGIMEGSLGS